MPCGTTVRWLTPPGVLNEGLGVAHTGGVMWQHAVPQHTLHPSLQGGHFGVVE